METFAANIARTRNHPFYINCAQSNSHITERELTQQFTNLLYHQYKTPLFTIETACCKMPTNIAGVWRNNLEKILNFLNLINTGVKGFVKTINGQPLRNATIRVVGNQLVYNVTKNLGHFRIILPAGPMQLEFRCDNYERRTVSVLLNDGSAVDMGDVILQSAAAGREHPQDQTPTSIGVVAIVKEVGGINNTLGSVTGFVLDLSNRPLERAKVVASNLKGAVLKESLTDSLGAFKIEQLPAGDLKLSARASGMVDASSAVHVSPMGIARGNIFHLESDEHVWGVPRLLFVLVVGCVLVGAMACLAFCITTYRTRKDFNNYSFSLLPQNKDRERPLFEDDDDDEEDTEVYRAPIKSKWGVEYLWFKSRNNFFLISEKITAQPYFDEEDVIYSDDDDDEDDDILMVNKS